MITKSIHHKLASYNPIFGAKQTHFFQFYPLLSVLVNFNIVVLFDLG